MTATELARRIDRLAKRASTSRNPGLFRTIGMAREFLLDGNLPLAEQMAKSAEAMLGRPCHGTGGVS